MITAQNIMRSVLYIMSFVIILWGCSMDPTGQFGDCAANTSGSATSGRHVGVDSAIVLISGALEGSEVIKVYTDSTVTLKLYRLDRQIGEIRGLDMSDGQISNENSQIITALYKAYGYTMSGQVCGSVRQEGNDVRIDFYGNLNRDNILSIPNSIRIDGSVKTSM